MSLRWAVPAVRYYGIGGRKDCPGVVVGTDQEVRKWYLDIPAAWASDSRSKDSE
jgi:hypothetical protein